MYNTRTKQMGSKQQREKREIRASKWRRRREKIYHDFPNNNFIKKVLETFNKLLEKAKRA